MYLINKTDGNLVAQIADGTSNISTSLTLVGRNFVGYGELLQEDLVKILENFAYNQSYISSGAGSGAMCGASANFLDSPATTSAVTYKTQFANFNNGVGSVYVNDYGSTQATSTITLLEIAA